jgi:hypothetical protein
MTSSSNEETCAEPDSQKGEIQAMDALFEQAGLKRNLRGKAGGVTLRMRFERALAAGASHQRATHPHRRRMA